MKEFPHNGHVSAGLRFCTSFGGVLYLEQEHTHYASTECVWRLKSQSFSGLIAS